jgi:HTH-type transcriptional repressor of NAD biosynthesis genes
MAKKMAEYFNTEYVPEVARELITSNDFSIDDIIRIGKAQTQRVFEKSKIANKVLFCDTDIITTQIYSRHYLGIVPPVLFELEKGTRYDLYLLFDIDLPWVHDGLRDLGDVREEMFQKFKSGLTRRGIEPTVISGSFNQREAQVIMLVNRLLDNEFFINMSFYILLASIHF